MKSPADPASHRFRSRPRPLRRQSPRRGAASLPLLGAVVAVAAGGLLLAAASSPSSFQQCGAVMDGLLADTIEDWLDIDTFNPPGLRPTDHPVARWMMDAMRPEHPVLIRPEAGAANGDADREIPANHGPGHAAAAGSGDVTVW